VKLVIDANVGWKALVPEQNSDTALKLLDGFRKGMHELLGPDLYPIEIGNILVTAARSGKVKSGDLTAMYAELMASLPIIHQSISLFPRAFDIASQTRASVYDALYVALAEREGCDLVTADDKLVKALPGFPIVSLASL
jgi:predicted nucleic acid-binding protein